MNQWVRGFVADYPSTQTGVVLGTAERDDPVAGPALTPRLLPSPPSRAPLARSLAATHHAAGVAPLSTSVRVTVSPAPIATATAGPTGAPPVPVVRPTM